MKPARIAFIGDFNPEVLAHRAINESLELWRAGGGLPIEPLWMGTDTILPGDEAQFRRFSGFWCVPATPYCNTAGALWAIEFARTHGVPFLGTCGGFQHAILEYARNALGLAGAEHAELQPEAPFQLLHRMRCSLVEKSQIVLAGGRGRFAVISGAAGTDEGYHCNFGLNPAYEHLFQSGALEIVARSEDGDVRAIELRDHPFFFGTLYQPERRALRGELHPLVRAFFTAACPNSKP